MHLSPLPDYDVTPLGTADTVTVLVDITAPEREDGVERAPATLQIVLDRSGSMQGRRLSGAIEALRGLVSRLAPSDNFGLVSFDNEARVEVPCGPLTDKAAVRRTIASLRTGGSTDLSSGLLRGIQEARRAGSDRGATLLLVSDGHANQGVTDHDLLRQVANDAYAHGITTTTLGYGLGYDEELLGAVADGGAGSALFAEDPDTAGGLIAQEAEYLLAKTAQAVSLRVPAGPRLAEASVVGEMPSSRLPDGSLMVELGDFHSGESRRLLLSLKVPVTTSPGPVTVAEPELSYVDPATLTTRTVTLPITVNVVSAEEAADRVRRPEVRTEEALQRAQTAKRKASEALRRGEREASLSLLEHAMRNLSEEVGAAPPAAAEDLGEQVAELNLIMGMTRSGNASRASKSMYASQSGYSRKRERRQRMVRPQDEGGGGGDGAGGSGGGEGGTGARIRGHQSGGDLSYPDRTPPHPEEGPRSRRRKPEPPPQSS